MTMIWGGVAAVYALVFIAHYAVLPNFDVRYRAVLVPGEAMARELTDRFRAVTGRAPPYIISEMWLGGNISHYSRERPRVLIDGNPARGPWIDLADLRKRGALVVWTGEPVIPASFCPNSGKGDHSTAAVISIPPRQQYRHHELGDPAAAITKVFSRRRSAS